MMTTVANPGASPYFFTISVIGNSQADIGVIRESDIKHRKHLGANGVAARWSRERVVGESSTLPPPRQRRSWRRRKWSDHVYLLALQATE